jgi:hypothetical protein
MTNRELLRTSEHALGEQDRLLVCELHLASIAMPCPACDHSVSVFAAAGIDVDEYRDGNTRDAYSCCHCAVELEQIVPVIVGGCSLWLWQLRNPYPPQSLPTSARFEFKDSQPSLIAKEEPIACRTL